MRFGDFTATIPEGREGDEGHVAVPHGEHYTIWLANCVRPRCDAEVKIDGKVIGTFRLDAYRDIILERSPDDHGRFTFYKSGTGDAAKAGEAGVGAEDKGLVQVTFTPEKFQPGPSDVIRVMHMKSKGVSGQSMGALPLAEEDEKTCAGITGLSGHSDQAFVGVGPIEYDLSGRVTITLRLVSRDDGPRPLKPKPAGNPVPKAV